MILTDTSCLVEHDFIKSYCWCFKTGKSPWLSAFWIIVAVFILGEEEEHVPRTAQWPNWERCDKTGALVS